MLKSYDGGWIDRGIRVGVHAPWISHLLFADDCLIFMRADGRSVTCLNEILEAYCLGSVQQANKQKKFYLIQPI